VDKSKVTELFDRFRSMESTRRTFYMEGIVGFYEAIGVDCASDLIFWYISMQMKATIYEEYLEAEFMNGCVKN